MEKYYKNISYSENEKIGGWSEISEVEISSVTENLKQFWPRSAHLQYFIAGNSIFSRKSGRTKLHLYFNKKNGLLIASVKGMYRRAAIFSPTNNFTGIESALEGNNIINWDDGSITLHGLPLELYQYLQDVSLSIGKRLLPSDDIFDCYWMSADDAKALKVKKYLTLVHYNSVKMENVHKLSRAQGSGVWNEIPEDEIPSIVESLIKSWPTSLHMYNFITESMMLGRKSRRTNITLFQNSQTGLLIAASKGIYCRAVVFSSSRNYSGIETILEGNNLKNWDDGSLLLSVISLDLAEHLEDLCPSIAKTMVHCDGLYDCYWMPAKVAKALHVECPDEMYFSALEDCHTEIVNSTWKYGSSEIYGMVSDIIKFMETVGLFTKDSKLVSWALNAVYGIGLVHTIEEYRNNGYGTLVVKKLANILGKTDRNPFLVTLQSNSVAKSMIEKCSFIPIEPAVFMEMHQNVDSV